MGGDVSVSLVITLQAQPDTDEQATRSFEALGRAAAGLALDGIYVRIDATTVDIDEDGEATE